MRNIEAESMLLPARCILKTIVIILFGNNGSVERFAGLEKCIVASVTTNMNLADAPGNIYLDKEESFLSKDSVVNISQISTIDKRRLIERVKHLFKQKKK